jgi:Flp pilus assembly protein TadG
MDRLHEPSDDTAPRRSERGQIVIIYALMLPVLLGMVALGVDVAYVFSEKRDVQSAADLAALAGAYDLPDAASGAPAKARSFATKNGFTNGVDGVGVSVATPYKGDNRKIEVTITRVAPTFFGRVLGVASVNITARAVAYSDPAGYALFATKTGCGANNQEAIQWSGSTAIADGRVHSNSGIKVSGSDNSITGATTYVCDKHISGSSNTFGSGPTKTGTKTPPVSFTADDFLPCTFTIADGKDIGSDEGSWWESPGKSSKKLKPGIYCATGLIKLSGSDLSGTVTLVAKGANGKVHVSGSNFNLKPYVKDVLIYAESSQPDAAKLSGSGGTWEGVLYGPNGQVDISGSGNLAYRGMIVSSTIKLSGSNWGITRLTTGKGKARLVE